MLPHLILLSFNRYIQLFYKDLAEIVEYISANLSNPIAANNLIDRVEKAIFDRLGHAEAFEIYQTIKERRYQYYKSRNSLLYLLKKSRECR